MRRVRWDRPVGGRRSELCQRVFRACERASLGRSQGKTLVRAVSALAVARVEAEVLGRIEDEFD